MSPPRVRALVEFLIDGLYAGAVLVGSGSGPVLIEVSERLPTVELRATVHPPLQQRKLFNFPAPDVPYVRSNQQRTRP